MIYKKNDNKNFVKMLLPCLALNVCLSLSQLCLDFECMSIEHKMALIGSMEFMLLSFLRRKGAGCLCACMN